MYITYDKETKRVVYVGEKKPISFSEGLELAEVDMLPEKYNFLTVESVREDTRTWMETVEEYDEENDEFIKKEIEHSETRMVAEVKANFIELTEEQIAEQKQKAYKARVQHLVGLRYSIYDELAIQRQRHDKPEEFAEYNSFVEQCKATAKEE